MTTYCQLADRTYCQLADRTYCQLADRTYCQRADRTYCQLADISLRGNYFITILQVFYGNHTVFLVVGFFLIFSNFGILLKCGNVSTGDHFNEWGLSVPSLVDASVYISSCSQNIDARGWIHIYKLGTAHSANHLLLAVSEGLHFVETCVTENTFYKMIFINHCILQSTVFYINTAQYDHNVNEQRSCCQLADD